MNIILEARLLQTIQSFGADMTAFCSRLLQIPSVNGVNDEVVLAEVIAEQVRMLGLHAQLVGENPRRPNVIVSTSPEGDTGLLLLGHLDTVPPGDEARWTYPPFSGTIRGERIYGRGAVDTKGGMTAALYALVALTRTEGALENGRVQLIGVPDEESGATGELGIKYLHREGLLNGLGAIYAYSGDQITLGHRGLLRYKLTCSGEAVHTGFMEWQDGKVGANAVTGMAALLLECEQFTSDHSTVRYFEDYRTVITPGTIIKGGISINIVPDYCEALVDIRLTPEYDLTKMDALFQEMMAKVAQNRPKLKFEAELMNYVPAAISDENALVVTALEYALQRVKGKSPERVVAGPANEGYLMIECGIPTICGFGPTGENAHAVDEYVEIKSLVDTAGIFCLTAHEMSKKNPS